MLEPRVSGCHYYFLLIVASGLTRWCGSSAFLISFPRHSSGTCPMKLKTCQKDLSACRPFLCLIIGGFRLLINASLYSWISRKACLLNLWDWTAQVEGLGASPPHLFPTPGNVCAIHCGPRQTLSYPAVFSFSNSSTEWEKPTVVLGASVGIFFLFSWMMIFFFCVVAMCSERKWNSTQKGEGEGKGVGEKILKVPRAFLSVG